MTSKNFLAMICIAAISSFVTWSIFSKDQNDNIDVEQFSQKYNLLNPNIHFSDDPVIDKAGYKELKDSLEEKIAQYKTEEKIKEVSIFFRDLNNGPTFNINEERGYIPASLLKLPLMLTYFKLAEVDPTILDRELSDNSLTNNVPQRFPSTQIIEERKPYKVDELIRRLIVYSDNRALEILWDYLAIISPDKNLFLETYKELGIIESDGTTEESITAKSYGSIFRLLYNASYLSKELSQKALDYLAQAEFSQGLKRGLPSDVRVAHKFGERISGSTFLLHDCGIVYYPKNPYLICVMAEGTDWDKLTDVISTISKSVYDEVDSRKIQ